MSDVVARVKAALDKVTASDELVSLRFGLALQDLTEIVPELVAELEQLRRWHENQADKLERVLVTAHKWTERDASELSKIFGQRLFQALAIRSGGES